MKRLNELIDKAREKKNRVAIAVGEDPEVLKAVKKAVEYDLCTFSVFGNEKKAREICELLKFEDEVYQKIEFIDCENEFCAVQSAIKSVSDNKCNLLMKGHVKTATLLREFLNEKYDLRTKRVMNLVSVFEIPGYDKLLISADAGMVISPTLEQKAASIVNCVLVANSIEVENPRVAVISAVEVVNEKMPATLDAAILSKMNDRNQIKGAIVDGPFALDNAISETAAKNKGITGPVAGKADILIMPDIQSGNVFYKTLVFLAKSRVASSVIGGKKPIILTSRADNEESKLFSIALNILISESCGNE
ncbi:MAG: phosphate butyryltransferase [Kosmotogales bacterium]|nr:phosphate butyryltransferase [Kosmotogales bacterium]